MGGILLRVIILSKLSVESKKLGRGSNIISSIMFNFDR